STAMQNDPVDAMNTTTLETMPPTDTTSMDSMRGRDYDASAQASGDGSAGLDSEVADGDIGSASDFDGSAGTAGTSSTDALAGTERGTVNSGVAGADTGNSGIGNSGNAADEQQFSSLDGNGDGFVERNEWLGSSSGQRTADFDRFDSNGDGRLDNYEFDTYNSAGFARLDANADGRVDAAEANSFQALGSDFANADTNADGSLSEFEHRAFIDSG